MHETQLLFQETYEPIKEVNLKCKDGESDIFAMEVFDDPFDAFHPTLSDSSVKHDNFSPCPLFTLARELRDIIYTDLIITGHVKLAQASKAFALEFMELIGKKGICRLTTNETKGPRLTPFPKLGKPLADTIQHLDLRLVTGMHKWNRGHREYSRDRRMEKIFGDPSVPRKSCHVDVEEHLPPRVLAPHDIQNRFIPLSSKIKYLRPLQLLGGFQTLTIKVTCTVDSAERPWNREQSERVANAYAFTYCVLAASLRGSLGKPVTRINGQQARVRYLEFRPRAYQEALAREGGVPSRAIIF